MKGMTWQILLPWLKRQDGSEAVLVSPDSIRVSEGRRFQIQIKRKQGESSLLYLSTQLDFWNLYESLSTWIAFDTTQIKASRCI